MTTTDIPRPYHRWAANENSEIRPFGLRDRCLACGVRRLDPMPGPRALEVNAVAAAACPQKPWRQLTDDEIAARVADYTS